jgi:hypothetical protein
MYDHVIDMEHSTPKARLCAYKGPVARILCGHVTLTLRIWSILCISKFNVKQLYYISEES